MQPINILIVDDEKLLRDALRSMLRREEFVKEIYDAGSEDEFLECIKHKTIDLILLDVRLRTTNGFALLEKLKELQKQPKVISVTGLEGTEVIVSLLKAGVHGIVYKLDGYSDITKAINNVLLSGTYFTINTLNVIQANVNRWQEIPPVVLTMQEKDMLQAIANGDTTKELAVKLKITPATAETYRIRLMKKIGAPNTAALLAYSFRNGIL